MKLLIVVLLSSFAFGQLPNHQYTPGVVRTTDRDEICSKSFRTSKYRLTTYKMKKQVCRLYTASPCPKARIMEIDHLIPLELGGADVGENLWVEFAWYPKGPGYHIKDRLEWRLRAEVCHKRISLKEAQECIRDNWIKCYEQTFHTRP